MAKRIAKKQPLQRIVMTLSPKVTKIVRELQKALELQRGTEVARWGIGLANTIVSYKRQGYDVFLIKKGKPRERIVFPDLISSMSKKVK